jgi:hypothetical protein
MESGMSDDLKIDHGVLCEWVTEFEDAMEDSRALSEKSRDYYDSKQWTEAEVRKLKAQKQAPTVSNRIKPKIDSLMGMETTNRTTAKAFPRTQKHEKASEAATESIRFVLKDNSFETVRSSAFENMLIEMSGGCEVIVKPSKKDEKDYKVIINHIPCDRQFYDPHCRTKHVTEKTSRYAGQIVWMDLDEAIDQYPEGKDVLNSMLDGSSAFEDKPRWFDSKRKRAKIVEIYYNKEGDIYYSCFTKTGYLEKPKISPYKNEEEETEWPYEYASLFVDRDGGRYGAVRQLLDMQDEINKRRSKALHLMSVRQVRGERGAVEDVEKARKELAKPDGYIETTPGMEFEVLKTGDMAAAQFNLLTEAKQEIDAVGANAALMGKTTNQDASGRALLAREAAGKTELAPVFDVLKGWDYRVYKKVWNRIHQYWKAEKWIRVTDDEQNLRWVGLNKPMTRGELALQTAQEQGADPQALAQLQQQIAMDPMSKEVVHTQNDIVEMDVDLVLDDVPDAITSQIEDFQTLGEMVKSGFPIPPMAVIEASPLTNKSRILKMMKEQPQVPPQIQEQMKKMQEELQKTTEENQQLKAGAQVEGAKIQADQQASAAKMAMQKAEKEAELQLQREAQAAELQLAREKAAAEIEIKRMMAEADLEIETKKLELNDKHETNKLAMQHRHETAKIAMTDDHENKKLDIEKQKMKKEADAKKEVDGEAVAPELLKTMKGMVDTFTKAMESRDKHMESLVKEISKPKTITAKSSSGATLTATTH